MLNYREPINFKSQVRKNTDDAANIAHASFGQAYHACLRSCRKWIANGYSREVDGSEAGIASVASAPDPVKKP